MLLDIPRELIEHIIVNFIDEIMTIVMIQRVCKELSAIISKEQLVKRILERELETFILDESTQLPLALHMNSSTTIFKSSFQCLSMDDVKRILIGCASISHSSPTTHIVTDLLLEMYSAEQQNPLLSTDILTLLANTGQMPAEIPQRPLRDRLWHLYYYTCLSFNPRRLLLHTRCFELLPIINVMRPWTYFAAVVSILSVESTATSLATAFGIGSVLAFMLIGDLFVDSPWDFLPFVPSIVIRLIMLYEEIINWLF